MASYVWSHVNAVLTSDDPSLEPLQRVLGSSRVVKEAEDPVLYDPRHHSRHGRHDLYVGGRDTLTLTWDLVWGRYSAAPRSLYLTLYLTHDGHTHTLGQVGISTVNILS